MPVHRSSQDGVVVLTLDRPERRNALDGAMWEELRDAAQASEGARVVIITGAGGHFCAGMDLAVDNPLIARVGPALMSGDEGVAHALIRDLKACVQAIADLSCPTYAAIEGTCVGGGLEIALACDVRIAAENAVLSLPEARIGMIPDLGGCARLTRLVGPGRAADLIATGRRLSGAEAFTLGVVERVALPGRTLDAARNAAQDILGNAPEAVRLALTVVRVSSDLGLTEALSVETRAGVLALVSGEAVEGLTAFQGKRSPRWPA